VQIELHDQTRQAFLQFSDHRADCQLLKRDKIQTAAQGSNSVTSQMGKNLRANIVGTQSRTKPRRCPGILSHNNLFPDTNCNPRIHFLLFALLEVGHLRALSVDRRARLTLKMGSVNEVRVYHVA
jgi:hypothetical protein